MNAPSSSKLAHISEISLSFLSLSVFFKRSCCFRCNLIPFKLDYNIVGSRRNSGRIDFDDATENMVMVSTMISIVGIAMAKTDVRTIRVFILKVFRYSLYFSLLLSIITQNQIGFVNALMKGGKPFVCFLQPRYFSSANL